MKNFSLYRREGSVLSRISYTRWEKLVQHNGFDTIEFNAARDPYSGVIKPDEAKISPEKTAPRHTYHKVFTRSGGSRQ